RLRRRHAIGLACGCSASERSRKPNHLAGPVHWTKEDAWRPNAGAREHRIVPELLRFERAAREHAALENAVLRLVVIKRRPVLVEHLLELDHLLILVLDQKLRACFEDGRRRERL